MSREAKTVIGLAIVAFLALAAYRSMSTIVALCVVIIGILSVLVVLRRSTDDPAPGLQRRRKQSTTELLESATSTVQPLTPWSPPESLKPWSPLAEVAPTTFPESPADDAPTTDFAPPTDVAPPTDYAPATDEVAPPVEEATTRDFWAPTESAPTDFSDLAPSGDETSWLDDPFGKSDDDDAWADGSTWDGSNITADTNPLDELSRLDNVDVIAEFERLETRDTLAEPDFEVVTPVDDERAAPIEDLTAFNDLAPINEAVSSADDILAASQATELHVPAEGENSELAKLLAKVQARLAAYE